MLIFEKSVLNMRILRLVFGIFDLGLLLRRKKYNKENVKIVFFPQCRYMWPDAHI